MTKTVSAVCEQYGIPMINSLPLHLNYTQGEDSNGSRRTTPHDVTFTKDLFEFLEWALPPGKVKGVKTQLAKQEIINIASGL